METSGKKSQPSRASPSGRKSNMSSLTISLEVAGVPCSTPRSRWETYLRILPMPTTPPTPGKSTPGDQPALKTAAGYLGMGARVDQIIQQRDQYLERSLMRSIASQSDMRRVLRDLAAVGAQLLDDGDEGISSALGTFGTPGSALPEPLGAFGTYRRPLKPPPTWPRLFAMRAADGRYRRRSGTGSPE